MLEKDHVGKIIDKYRVDSVLSTTSSGITIMRAINVTNYQLFIIKKIFFNKENDKTSNLTTQSEEERITNSESTLLYNEVNSIKDISISKIIKCLQMIKTKRNLYLVFQNFPQYTLDQYLHRNTLSLSKKVKIAKILCQFLKQLHQKKYVYLALMPSSIYVIQNSLDDIDLRFVGFQHCQKLKDNIVQISNTDFFPKSPYIAPEIASKIATTSADIYSAGKIFQLLTIFSLTDNNVTDHVLIEMCQEDPKKRSTLSKVWQCLKVKENDSALFQPKGILVKHKRKEKSRDDSYLRNQKVGYQVRSPQKKSIQDQERRLRKILHIRNLVIYLHDEANFVLRQRDKQLYYLLIKKSVIVRANLVYEIKRMLNLYSGDYFTKLNKIKQTLTQEQNDILNLLSKVQNMLKIEQHSEIASELDRRNQLDEKLLDVQILSFVSRKRREIKPFHSILNQKERQKLINLCGLAEKLAYGSFQKFFDQVMDENELNFGQQKYFSYLKTASTREILERLEKIGNGTLRIGSSY